MENEIENAMKFINKIKDDDSINQYNKNIKQMKNLLNIIICELNPNIEKENINKLDSTQLWTLISSISKKNINDFKTQTKSITEIKNELNNFNNSNYLEKKRKRNNKIVKSKSKKEIENEEEENIENEEVENIENEEEENIENEEEENLENEEEENIENEEENENIKKEIKEKEEENTKIKKEKDSKENKLLKNKLDDEFFSLEKMNEFADMLDEKDLKAAPSRLQLTTQRKNSEINSLSSEEAEIEAEENSKEEIKFNQFFDKPENKNLNNKNIINSDSEEGENGIFNQIKEIEKQMLSKKKWNMKGEVTSKERPIDSLLSNPMDFEISLKNPPIPNQEYTNLLENIIKNRIKDNLFDDPIYKNPLQLNKKNQNDFEINFSKSQKGLGDIYEEEYIGNKLSQSKSDEIKKECDIMCEELYKVFDRLTNSHFMPHNIPIK